MALPGLENHGEIPHSQNLPEVLHDRLAAAAKRQWRSLNYEAILCLEAGLISAPHCEDRLMEIRSLRYGLPAVQFDPAVIEGFNDEGRTPLWSMTC